MEDLETQNEDFGNQVINLENQTKEESLNINSELEKNRATETTKLPNLASMILSSEKDKITENVVNNFTSDMKKSYIEKMLCFLNYFRQYFRITTKEVEQRIISSFKPYNSKFYEEASNNPDLYGPFWIYTTLIFVIASGGSLSKYFNGDNSKNYFQSFVRSAGSLIYIFGFGLPFLIMGYIKFIGEVISYFYILCIYGYSFSPFIPIIILCSCGINVIQWILLCYAIGNSTLFIITNLWKEISKQEQKKKYSLIGIIVSFQFILFLILKLYFLENNNAKIKNLKNKNNKIE